jgi:hypothetical protein
MKVSRHNIRQPPSSTGSVDEDDRLRRVRPVHIDYDEARSSEERSTYHRPRLAAQGEFLLDVHPVTRLKSILARATRVR